jgi:diadenosine tetraphosphate (Ap4A) HIT family hydrolase/5-methylcytosine-specific restriction endonuclease McrA
MLEHSGSARIDEIATAFLMLDQSQLEYYGEITKNMPGKVLGKRGIVIRDGGSYRLADKFSALTENERTELIGICNEKVREYLGKRGDAPWNHRKRSSGYVPGSLRYDVLVRAKGRCEACGIDAADRALEVDHIIPRNCGGTDDPANLQALCYQCNAQKRDRDDTDFGAVRSSYAKRKAGCLFCELPHSRIIAENELALAIRDGYPVTPLHTLIIPKRHVADYFDLHAPERNAIEALLRQQRDELSETDKNVSGFNIGINAGETAGQSIFHVHVHLIPRRSGDVEKPRGGVRGVIPGKQAY